MTTATIAVCDSPGSVGLRSCAAPKTSGADGILRVEASGICGTDIAIFRGRLAADRMPVSLGHEIVGTIEKVGDQAAQSWGVAPGDRVFVQEFLPCRQCRMCKLGQYAMCAQTDFINNREALRYGATPVSVRPSLWGGFADTLYLHPASIVHPLPDESVPSELATLLVPLANGVDWVRYAGSLQQGHDVVIFGPGQHGLGCVVAASRAGAGRIVVVGTCDDEVRLAAARQLGATEVYAVADSRERESVLETDAFDLAIDTSGAPDLVETLVRVTGPAGRIVLAASGPAAVDVASLSRKALTIVGVRGRRPDAVDEAIGTLSARRRDLQVLCSHSFDLRSVSDALATAGAGSADGAIHVSVRP